MAFNIGAVVSVQGEAAYQKAMQGIRQSMTYVRAEANNISSAYDKNDKSAEALTARNKSLNAALDLQKQAVEQVKAALSRMEQDGVDPASDAYQKMTANLNNAQAEFNKTSREIEGNEQAIAQLSENAKAEKLQKFRDALKGIGEVAGKAVAVGLKATAAAMAAVGTAAVAAGAALWKNGKNAGEFADDLLTLSAQTGLSVQKLQELQYASRFVDVEVDSLAKGMARTVAAMRESVNAGKDYIEAAGGIKIAMQGANGQTKSTEQVFSEAIDALGGMTDETMREVAAQDLFGKSYQDLMPLIKAGSGALNKYAEEARAAGLVLSDEMVAKLGEFDDVMQRTQAQTEGIGRQLAVTFLPALQKAGTGISEFLSVVTNALKDGIQPGDVKTIGAWISEKLVEGLKSIKQYLPQVIKLVSGMLSETASVLVATLPEVLPVLMEGAFQLIQGLIEAITANAQPLADMVTTMVTQLTLFILENLPTLIAAAAQILIAIATGIAENLPTLIPAVVQAVLTIANTLIENIGLLIPAALQIMVALIQGLAAALPQLISYLPTIVQTITTTLINNLPLILEAAWQIIVALGTGIVNALPELGAALLQIMGVIWETIKGLASQLWDVGKNIVQGIWAGIQKAAAWFKSQVTNFFKGIVNGVKKVLGIKSPSKVFAGIGQNMALGLGQGFAAAMQGVGKTIQASIPKTSADISVTGSKKGLSAAAAALAPNLTINTHDSLSPYEILQEYMNFQRRVAWQS